MNFNSLFPKKSETSIGIDIDGGFINLVQLKRKCKHLSNNDTAKSCEIVKSQVCQCEDFYKNLKQKTPIVVALPYSSIFTKVVSLDASLNYFEIKKYLLNNIEKYFNLPIQELYFDFEVIKKKWATKTDVIVVATKHDDVSNILKFFDGIKLKALDVEHFALLRAVLRLFKFKDDELTVAVHCKRKYLLICFIQNKQIIKAREIAVSADIQKPVNAISSHQQHSANNCFNQVIIDELQSFFAHSMHPTVHLLLSGCELVEKVDIDAIKIVTNSKIDLINTNTVAKSINKQIPNGHDCSQSFMLAYGLALWRNCRD